jgi:hypothetical protein
MRVAKGGYSLGEGYDSTTATCTKTFTTYIRVNVPAPNVLGVSVCGSGIFHGQNNHRKDHEGQGGE